MDLQKVRRLAEAYSGGMRKLASDIGMSEANLHRCVRENKIQAGDLEKIAHALQVHIGYFFDEELTIDQYIAYGNRGMAVMRIDTVDQHAASHCVLAPADTGSTERDLRDQIAQLKSQLADKERIIQLLEMRLQSK